MSEMNGWNGSDPFAPEQVEDSIARSLWADASATSTTVLVRALADAYTLPPVADSILAHSRATLARRATTLDSERRQTRGLPRISTDFMPSPARRNIQPPQPPQRQLSSFETVLRTAAAVLVVTLLSAAFFALLHGLPRRVAHPTPTATHRASTPTTIPAQPPAPAGVYVATAGALFRLNLSTGAIQQRYPLAAPSQWSAGTPIVANGIVYYSSYVSPQEFAVVAVSATTGAQLWRTPTAAELVQLMLADGTLYGATASSTITGSDMLYALRASDGSVLWTFPTSTWRGLAVVTGGVMYVANQPQNTSLQHLHALRASDGSQLWDTALPQACGMVLGEAVDQGMVFVGCGVQFLTGQGGNGVYALHASDGSVLWHNDTNGSPNVVATGVGLVYLSLSTKNSGALDALDEMSGAVRWQAANADGWLGVDGTTVYAEVASSSTFTAPASSNLAAFSAVQGTLLWTFSEANQQIEPFAPVIAGGVVYVGLNGQVVAISAASGSELWRSPGLVVNQQELGGLSVVAGG